MGTDDAGTRMGTDDAGTRMGANGPRIVPEPSPAMAAVVADLLWPTSLTTALLHDEVRSRLLDLLRRLLAARRSMVLQWEPAPTSSPAPRAHPAPATYTVWCANAAGALHTTGQEVPACATPLPLVAALGSGMLVERPQESGAVDPALARLLGPAPALLLPLAESSWGVGGDILVLSLDAMPREGELTLALALARRGAAVLSGASGADRALPSGGRAARRYAAHDAQVLPAQLLSPRDEESCRWNRGHGRGRYRATEPPL
jgi:hypothetical protein